MNSNPFPQDINSGQIKSLGEFNPDEPYVELDKSAQEILMKIPAQDRVEYLKTSTEKELEEARKQLFRQFADRKCK